MQQRAPLIGTLKITMHFARLTLRRSARFYVQQHTPPLGTKSKHYILFLAQEARDSAGSDDYDPCWSCAVIASRTCAAAGRTDDAVRLLQELPVDGDERERVATPRTDSDGSPSLSSVGSPASLPTATAMATEGNSEDPAKWGAGGRKEEAWLEAFWAAAGTGDAEATLAIVGAAREAGVALTIEHYNRALRALAGGSRSRWR